ncbi:MAG: NAD(P)/FAD-dependent oxidoreductase [Emergencia sp.]
MKRNRYRIHQIKLSLHEDKSLLPTKIQRKIGKRNIVVRDVEIVKESLDARNKQDIRFVYTADFTIVSAENPNRPVKLSVSPKMGIEVAPDMGYSEVSSGQETLENSPVIVGFGPCGMFAGLLLASRGYRPIIIERGAAIEERIKDVETFWNGGKLNPESNVQFGEGGAGTFSDGKLTTGIKDPRIRKVLTEFVKAGADEDILYKQRPHIGTDVLRCVVKSLRHQIIDLGGQIHFHTKLTGIQTDRGQIKGITAVKDGETIEIPTENVILAIGHSARDTFRYLYGQGVEMSQKPFSIGVRIEHPQSLIDRAQYGDAKGLPPADYKLSHRCENGRGVYTFCMCPGGEVVVASSQTGGVVTNGMSNRARNSGMANSGLLVDVRCEDFSSEHPLAGIEFQEKYERLAFENGGRSYQAPKTTWGEFRDGNLSAESVIHSLPDFAVEALREAMPFLGRKLKGFDRDDALLTATETRSSSPVRFARDENLEGSFGGFYPAGEGAGYAGGIMSAACDGIRIAERIIRKYKSFE